MQRLLRVAVMLPILALLPVLAVAQNAKKTDFDETKVRSSQLNGTYIQGKLTGHDEEKREYTVTFYHQVKTPNLENQKKFNQLKTQYNAARARKDNAGAQKIADEATALQGALYNIEEFPVVFECQGDKSLAIRTLAKPVDDNGKVKKLSAAEEKKLKGDDPRLPGYTFDPKNLDNETIVRVYIDKSKLKALTPADKKDDKKTADKKTADKKDDKKPADKKEEPKADPGKPTIVKPGEKKPADEPKTEAKKPADKKDDKTDKGDEKSEKVIYPITMIVIVPPPMDPPATGTGGTPTTGGAVGGNPFIKK